MAKRILPKNPPRTTPNAGNEIRIRHRPIPTNGATTKQILAPTPIHTPKEVGKG